MFIRSFRVHVAFRLYLQFFTFLGSNSLPAKPITPEQRATYLPIFKALLKVMETQTPAPHDINTLLVRTRDLNRKVPKGQNLLGDFANFGVSGIESMGLPASGDIIVTINGAPHVKTNFGKYLIRGH